MRLERSYAAGESRDREIDDELSALRVRVQAARAERGRSPQSLDAIRAMFEELEIGRFAPKIPRRFAASERRLLEMLERAETGNARNARDAR
jgi:hypothetical protein